YLTAVPDMVARFVGRPMVALGTDGYGLSDTRQALRRHFQVDAEHVAYTALWQLAQQGLLEPTVLREAAARLAISGFAVQD
ncbi:MAG: hypothetical protein ACK42L_11010, partial [Thermoanaerobaculum sp.]